MGYLANLTNAVLGRSAPPESRSGSIEDPNVSISDALTDLGSVGSAAGETVTPRKALAIPALYQAVSMISGDVAKIPMGVWRRLPDDTGREIARGHHAFRHVNLIGMANPEINAFKFWRRLMVHALLWGNGYAWIDKNGRGEVLGLYNLLPDRTTPVRIKGKLWFLTEVGGRLVPLENDEVFHLEGVSIDGLCAENIVKLFRDHFGGMLARKKFSSRFFKQGMTAGGVLTVPPGSKPETVRKVKTGLELKYANSDNAFKTMVLRDGYKWFSTQVDPEKAQLTDWNENDVREIARIYNVRGGRLSVAGSTSYNAGETETRDYHDGTLSHWLIGARCEANAKLRTPEEIEADEVYLDHNINALHWADAKTRSEIAAQGIQIGRWSPNETRAWENLNPYDGGNVYYRPLNMTEVGTDPDAGDDGDDNAAGSRAKLIPPKDNPPLAAARQLAESTLERAKNRVGIKLSRGKSIDQAERDAVLAMIAPACTVLGRDSADVMSELTTSA
jgi:HK97 family phage portal protein